MNNEKLLELKKINFGVYRKDKQTSVYLKRNFMIGTHG
jgi:hypothetical protein